MNKLTLPRWWEVLILLLPIVGSVITSLIFVLLPIGVIYIYSTGNSLRIVRAWPLIQGMLLLSPILSTIGLVAGAYTFNWQIQPLATVIVGCCATSYIMCGLIYNRSVAEVAHMALHMKAQTRMHQHV